MFRTCCAALLAPCTTRCHAVSLSSLNIVRRTHSTALPDAAIVRTSDEARALLAESVADDVGAVGAYIAPVEIKESGKIKPGNLREHIRRRGVTIDLPASA